MLLEGFWRRAEPGRVTEVLRRPAERIRQHGQRPTLPSSGVQHVHERS